MTTDLTSQRLNDPLRRKVWPDDYKGDGTQEAIGVRCPSCNCADTRVDYTRHRAARTNMRKRICRACGREFTTYERTA